MKSTKISRITRMLGSLSQSAHYIIFVVALLLPNFVLFFSPYLSLTAALVNILAPAGLWMILLALLGARPGRVLLLWLPLILLVNMVQLVLLMVFEGAVVSVDLLLSLTAASGDEAGELLGGLILPIILVVLSHAIVITLAVCSWRRHERLGLRYRRRSSLIGLGLIVASVPLAVATPRFQPSYTLRGDIYPVSVFYNMYVTCGTIRKVANYEETSRAFRYDARSEHPEDMPEVYVFVLGETSRAYSWQLYDYERETNPRLAKRKDQLVVWHDLITQSNTTYKSAPIILSPADAEHCDRLPEVKGIMTAMKEAGFYTVFISNQPENRSYLDFFAYESDEHYRIRDIIRAKRSLMDMAKPIYDTEMLPFLDDVLAKGHRKIFVILHCYGAHWNYPDRYPRSEAHFSDDQALGANAVERPRLINAYDNAIRYTDYLLDQIVQRLEQLPATTAMYYTSDHGEDVFDDERERILHSSPSISYYQLHVPSILWASDAYRTHFASKIASAHANERQPATSRSNFHTLLELAGVSTKERIDSLSLMSKYYRPAIRTYLNDRYECVPVSEMLTAPEDKAMWKKMKLTPLD